MSELLTSTDDNVKVKAENVLDDGYLHLKYEILEGILDLQVNHFKRQTKNAWSTSK
ncbi:MAG: hypothetical protein K0B07_05195 [DPANN group archaeon]|nr:hypothetical protein [DPANN group archaeon]